MMKRLTLMIALLLTGCAAQSSPAPLSAPTTQSARLSIFLDMNGNLTVGGILIQASDLPLLVNESGADRHVVVNGVDFRKLVALKRELQAAGFKDVVIGPAVGE
jgi:uncharacterized lipoprotein YmbA